MGEKTYGELLRDPRWQKKRLEIMQRDGFECLHCGARDKTLHVNHRWYLARKKPWEYDDHILETLCEDCHAEVTKNQNKLKVALTCVGSSELEQIVAYVETLFSIRGSGEVTISSYASAQGVADALCVSPEMVIDSRDRENGSVKTERLEEIGHIIRRWINRQNKKPVDIGIDIGTDEVDA